MTTASEQDRRQRDDHFFLAAQRWLQRNEVTSVALVCHRGQDLPVGTKRLPAIEVPGCLADLPTHRLVDLFLAGLGEVAAVSNSCCSAADLADVVAGWQDLLGGLSRFTTRDAVSARNWTWTLSPTRVPVDRRGLLGLRHVQPPWPTHDAKADDHERLLVSLRAAGMTSLGEPPAALALTASGCTACGVCVAACPHDALALTTEGDQASLVHSPGACRGEQQCVSLCPVDALTVAGPLLWADVLDDTPRLLTTVRVAVCERCQAHFPASSGSQWCEPCRIRRSDPFGSHLPAAAIELLRARGHNRT